MTAEDRRGGGFAPEVSRGTALTLARLAGASILQLFVIIAIARLFGPQGTGVYGLTVLVPSLFVMVFGVGVAPANVRMIASRQFGARAVWRGALAFWALATMLGLVASWFVLLPNQARLLPSVPETFVLAMIALFPMMLLSELFASILNGQQRYLEMAVGLTLQPMVVCLGLFVGVVSGGFLFERLVPLILSSHLLSVIVLGFIARPPSEADDDRRGGSGYLGEALRFGVRAHLSNVLSFVNYRLDIYLVSILIGSASTGHYVLAVQLAQRLWILSQAVSAVVLPRVSADTNGRVGDDLLSVVLARIVLWATLALAVFVAIAAWPAIRLVFGANFEPAVLPLILLLPGIVCGAGARVLANGLAAQGHPGLNAFVALVVLAMNLGLNLILIPIAGLLGAAVATTSAFLVGLVLQAEMQRRITGTKPTRIFSPQKSDFALLNALRPGRSLS